MSDPALTLQTAATDIFLSIDTALAPASDGIAASDVDTALFGDALQAADGTAGGCAGLDREGRRGPDVDPGAGSRGLSPPPTLAGAMTGDEGTPSMLRVPLPTTGVLDLGGSALATLAGVRWVADGSRLETPIPGDWEKPAVALVPSSRPTDAALAGVGIPMLTAAAISPKVPDAVAGAAAQATGTAVPVKTTLQTLSATTDASTTAGTRMGIASHPTGRANTEADGGRRSATPPPGFNRATGAPTPAPVGVIPPGRNTAQPSRDVPDPATPATTVLAPTPTPALATALGPAAGRDPRSVRTERRGSGATAGGNGRTPAPGAGADPSHDLGSPVLKPKFSLAESERSRVPVADKPSGSNPSILHVPGTRPSAAPSSAMPDPVASAPEGDRRTAEGAGQNGVSFGHTKVPFKSPVAAAEHAADGSRTGLPPAPALPAEAPLTAPSRGRFPAANPALDTPARQDNRAEPWKQDEVPATRSEPLIGTSFGGLEPQLPVQARTPNGQPPNKETVFGKSDKDRNEPGTAHRITTDATVTTPIERNPTTASRSESASHPAAAPTAPGHDRRTSAEGGTSGGDGGREQGKAGSETVRPGSRVQRERADTQDSAGEAAQADAAASQSVPWAMPELFGQEAPLGLPVWTGSLDNDTSEGTADEGGRIRSGLEASGGRLEEPQADEEDTAGGDDWLSQRLRDEAAFVHVSREREYLLPEFLARDGLAVRAITDLPVVELVATAHEVVVPDRERIVVRFAATASMQPSGLAWDVWDMMVGQSPSPYEAQGPPSPSARKGRLPEREALVHLSGGALAGGELATGCGFWSELTAACRMLTTQYEKEARPPWR